MFINKNKRLLRAVEKEMNSEKIQNLISSGADVNTKNKKGQTSLKIINARISEMKMRIEKLESDKSMLSLLEVTSSYLGYQDHNSTPSPFKMSSDEISDEMSDKNEKLYLGKKGLEFLEEIKVIIIEAGGVEN